jgi:hypothetical protein
LAVLSHTWLGLAVLTLLRGVCFVMCLAAFGALSERRGGRVQRWMVPVSLIAAELWAGPLLVLTLVAGVEIQPAAIFAALLVAIAAAAAAIAAFRRCTGALRIIGPGAILGAGAAACQALMLFIRGAGSDFVFDDMPFSLAVTLISALAVGAFALFSRWRGVRGRLLAAGSLTLGLALCQALTLASLTAVSSVPNEPGLDLPYDVGAGAGVIALLAALAWIQRGPVRPATTGRVWRGSRRPFPGLSRAETASPRPAPARSAAVQAAGPARPAQPGR